MIRVIHGEIWSEDFTQLKQLMCDYSSCVRYAYCRFRKEAMAFNDVRKASKSKYPMLNTRQVSDAVVQAQALHTRHKDKKIIFGGKKAWEDLKVGLITKEQWLERRDNSLYCRGDATKDGNLNARVVGDHLRITVGKRQWANYKMFVPQKFQTKLDELLAGGKSYNVRLVRKDEQHYKVVIDYLVETPMATVGFENGAIGVDTNPDRIALANITVDGNLVETKTFVEGRLLYGGRGKRDYDIGGLVKKVIAYAKEQGKGIVFENLDFEKDFKPYEKNWNRKKSNFVWRRFIELLERKCVEHGIGYKKVNPAFTSIIGKWKYRLRYKLTIHESAAFVIGRRGLGFNEKLSFYGCPRSRVKAFALRTLAGKYQGKRLHSWRLWKALNDGVKTVLTGLRTNLPNLKELGAMIRDESENLSGEVFLQELLVGSNPSP